MNAPAAPAYDSAREAYEAHARRHPTKAARHLASLEARVDAGLVNTDTDDRLRGMADGLRAGLDGAVRCRKCGKELRDPESVARKVGPDCWAKERKAAA